MEPKILVEETWSSNKQFNTRVTAQTQEKPKSVSEERQASRTSTYQVPNGQVVHERTYGAKKLHLCVAVNGASKSMRGQLPLSNLDLTNGDFGDDAGMIVENRDYCFVGASAIEIDSTRAKDLVFQAWLTEQVAIVRWGSILRISLERSSPPVDNFSVSVPSNPIN